MTSFQPNSAAHILYQAYDYYIPRGFIPHEALDLHPPLYIGSLHMLRDASVPNNVASECILKVYSFADRKAQCATEAVQIFKERNFFYS